jgi:hypothetical protein
LGFLLKHGVVVVNGFLLKHGVVVIQWLGLAGMVVVNGVGVIRWLGLTDLGVVVVNGVVVDSVAWACRSLPGFAFSLPAWW